MTPPREIARSTRHTRGFTHLAIRRPLGTLAITAVVLVLGLFGESTSRSVARNHAG